MQLVLHIEFRAWTRETSQSRLIQWPYVIVIDSTVAFPNVNWTPSRHEELTTPTGDFTF